ncbi:MAG: hypothetical protein HKN91_16755, partial [Acidimicrobiia bacterium]|nr:hypothetical protein [Acidimicrobiia bacterium]
VYRFFAWGMMPIGSAIGGALVVGSELFFDRELSLRMPWFVAAAAYVLLLLYAAPKLTTEKIESARTAGVAAKEASGESTDVSGVADDALSEGGIPGAPPPIDD